MTEQELDTDVEQEIEMMTDKQTEIIEAAVKHPGVSDIQLSEKVDASAGYVNKVRNRYEKLIEHLIEENLKEVDESSEVAERLEEYDEEDINKNRTLASLTDKQRRTVHSVVELGTSASFSEIAKDAGVSDSYVGYVLENFPHIIDKRLGEKEVQNEMAADGGEKMFTIRLSESKAWKAVRDLPDELSSEIFEQITEQ